MGINKREQETLEQKAKTKRIIIIIAVVISIIALVVISILFNNRNTEKMDGMDNNNASIDSSDNSNKSTNSVKDKYNLTASEKELEKKFLEADKPVLVDYYADCCGPCVMMAPILEELKKEQEDFYIVKVDVDKNNNLAIKAGASSIPYFVLYNDGEFVASTIGVQSKENIITFVKNNIEK